MSTDPPAPPQTIEAASAPNGRSLLCAAIDGRDPTSWNAWRRAHMDLVVMLEDRSLDCAQLDGFLFHRVQFVRVVFLTARLRNCTFSETSFRECEWNLTSFEDCDLDGVAAYSIAARKACFRDCDLRGADLRGAILSSAVFERCDLTAATLSLADMPGATISDSALVGVSLTRADLSKAKITSSDLSDVDLRSANLTSARLRRCNLSSAKLWNVQVGSCRFVDIDCVSASFDEAGEQPVAFAPGRFERIYGGSLRVGLTFNDGLMVADLLAIPALIECLQREFPGCDIGVSSLSELGNSTEMVVTARSRTLLDEAENGLLQQRMEQRLAQLHGEVRSNHAEVALLRDSMLSLTERLVEHLVTSNRSLTFNGPVTAGVIGDGTQIEGDAVATSAHQGSALDDRALAQLITKIEGFAANLDAARQAEILGAIKTVREAPRSAGALIQFSRTIRNVAEGTVGSLAATGILALMKQYGLG